MNNNQGPPPAGLIPQNLALDLRTMEELCQPTMNGRGGPIAPVNIQATDFGLKNHMIQQSMKQNGVTHDVLRLCLFPYYLTHHATAWFDRLPKNSIHGWEEMVTKFLSKYFSPSIVTILRNDINTFYNGLTLRHWDTINVVARGTFMKRRPKECYDLIENMTAHHNDWDTSAQRGESSRLITSSSPEIAALTYCETCGDPHHYSECQSTGGFTQGDVHAATGNYNARDPQFHHLILLLLLRKVERDPKTTMNQIPERNPHQSPIPYPSRLNKDKLQDKFDIQIHKFLQMFKKLHKKLHFNISFAKALAQMPKYAKMLKDLLTNKEKLLELANTPLNENCSAVLLKKLPEKLGDPTKFLIPCDFSELEECVALADLGANINLMPPSVWKKLMLPELIPTLGKFMFPADFVVVDYDIDPRVPLILGRPFLRKARALVDVHGEELTLRVGDERLTFNKSIRPLSGSPTPSSDPVVASLSPSLTPFRDSDFLLEETDAFLALDDLIPPEIDNEIYDSEGDILFLENLLNDDPTKDLPPKELKND
ncbi:reverse transcriptase domain-containing protein [Tanacetum coccineum]